MEFAHELYSRLPLGSCPTKPTSLQSDFNASVGALGYMVTKSPNCAARISRALKNLFGPPLGLPLVNFEITLQS